MNKVERQDGDTEADLWLSRDDELRYVRRVLEAGRSMTDTDQQAAIDIIHALRVTVRHRIAASHTVDDNAAVHREEARLKSTESDRAARQVDAPLTDEQIDRIAFEGEMATYAYVNNPVPRWREFARAILRAALTAAPPRPE